MAPCPGKALIFRRAFEVDNAAAPAYTQTVVTAVYNPPGTNNPYVVTSQTGRVFVAQTPEAFTYDGGNILSDGRWQYTWNGENRLIKAEELVSPTNRQPCTVEYAYDHQGRMVWKQISRRGAEAQSWEIEKNVHLLWDGYNIVQSLIHSQTHTLTNSFTWGLDLSGTLQGAGGIGGLLAEVQAGTPYLAAFDANGNVTGYLSADGTIAAHYEYNPFCEIVVNSGLLADSFTHRFSTKPWCAVTGLSESLFRTYSPDMGRWILRDPIGEWSGPLFIYVTNQPQESFDALGLSPWDSTYECTSHFDRFFAANPTHKQTRDDLARGVYMEQKLRFPCRVSPRCVCCAMNPEHLANRLGGGIFMPDKPDTANGRPIKYVGIITYCADSETPEAILGHEFQHFVDWCTKSPDKTRKKLVGEHFVLSYVHTRPRPAAQTRVTAGIRGWATTGRSTRSQVNCVKPKPSCRTWKSRIS